MIDFTVVKRLTGIALRTTFHGIKSSRKSRGLVLEIIRGRALK